MLRPGRLLAVARYEMRSHMSGRQALRLLGVAGTLLLPASMIVTPDLQQVARRFAVTADPTRLPPGFVGPPLPPKVAVRGEIPPSLEWRLEPTNRGLIEIHGTNPVVVVAPEVGPDLRSALETLDGPVHLEYRSIDRKARLPGRSLLIAILAISLLTGPLADALPGERARRTLEVLLTAGITRGELVGGKWFAWTVSASLTAATSAAIACWRGVQAPGWWLAGLPLFVASAVAFGLWLVRLVDDVVGGSAAPMRVLPAAAGGMAALSYAMESASPVAAAAMPLGGSLLVSANLFTSASQVAAAAAGSAAFIATMLALTARDLDRTDTVSAPTRWGAFGLAGVAILLWWLTVAGPGVWATAKTGQTSDLVTPIERSMAVGGVALLACAGLALAREARRGPAPARTRPSAAVLVCATLAVSAALAASGAVPSVALDGGRPAFEEMLGRMRVAAVPATIVASTGAALAALLSVTGQSVLFRSVVPARVGWIVSGLMWAVAVSPVSPWSALAGSLALGALAEGCGWTAALVAQVAWAVGAGLASRGEASAIAVQAIALAIALAALRVVRGAPSRHQL